MFRKRAGILRWNNMKKIIFFLIAAACIILAAFLVQKKRGPHIEVLRVGSSVLHVETVRTNEALMKGLGGRDVLGSDGMLFILPVRDIPHFWMKDMRFGLDFVWVDAGKVVALTPHVPPQSGLSDSQLVIYSPQIPVSYVLEIPLGDIEKRGIHIGDVVSGE